jgi:hypothetical protein
MHKVLFILAVSSLDDISETNKNRNTRSVCVEKTEKIIEIDLFIITCIFTHIIEESKEVTLIHSYN